MKIVTFKDFSEVTDPVKTEEVISSNLEEEDLDTEYIYGRFPIADTINKHGLAAAQHAIQTLQQKEDSSKLFFVCQHILGDKLAFGDSRVFSPHASESNKFISIPHSSCVESTSKAYAKDVVFSFMGDLNSHRVRYDMYNNFPHAVIPTNAWHYNKSPEEQEGNKNMYSEVLRRSEYALCPRGTGISTIRLFECLSFGCIPIIIADGYVKPLEDSINWDDFSMHIEEKEVASIPQRIEAFDKKKDPQLFWNEYCSKDNLHLSILENLREVANGSI